MARKPRHLSAEEEKLWQSVAATTSPLEDRAPVKKPRPAKAKRVTKPVPVEKGAEIPAFRIGETSPGKPTPQTRLSPDIAARVSAQPVKMDQKAYRQLSRGRMKPEARIDLHGMTLARAHPALIRFIQQSHAAGHRLVLVITGKGRGGKDAPGPIPERRGALREQVPGWLAAPPCGAMVLQVAQAHQTHGGGGAYYVYLRRSRG